MLVLSENVMYLRMFFNYIKKTKLILRKNSGFYIFFLDAFESYCTFSILTS